MVRAALKQVIGMVWVQHPGVLNKWRRLLLALLTVKLISWTGQRVRRCSWVLMIAASYYDIMAR